MMADDIELIQDGESLVAIGAPASIEQFLEDMDIPKNRCSEFPLKRLRCLLDTGSNILKTSAEAWEKSARYIKLTKESAERVRQLGFMPTETKGICHAMVGARGSIAKWVQVETGPLTMLTNPALLRGAAGVMAQIARMIETQELNRFLESIDGKLDDVRRHQRDETLTRLRRVAALLDEAMSIREHDGHRETSWDKLHSEKGMLLEVQEMALNELGTLADKATTDSVRSLAKAARDLEAETGLWLAVLARCFQLHDQYLIVELDHVFDVAPECLDGHRLGLEEILTKRRDMIIGQTSQLMDRLEEAGTVARQNVLWHAAVSRKVVGIINAVGGQLEDFHAPLGIGWERSQIAPLPLQDAIRDRDQWRNAAIEARPMMGTAALGAAGVFLLGILRSRGQDDDESDV